MLPLKVSQRVNQQLYPGKYRQMKMGQVGAMSATANMNFLLIDRIHRLSRYKSVGYLAAVSDNKLDP